MRVGATSSRVNQCSAQAPIGLTSRMIAVTSRKDNPERRARFGRAGDFQARIQQLAQAFHNRKPDAFPGLMLGRSGWGGGVLGRQHMRGFTFDGGGLFIGLLRTRGGFLQTVRHGGPSFG